MVPLNSRPTTLVMPQQWKLWLLGAMVGIMGLLIFANARVGAYLGIHASAVELVGLAFGVITLIVGCLIIRCPSCGLSLLWHALSKKSLAKWLEWLLDVQTCPRCGFSHAAAPSESSR